MIIFDERFIKPILSGQKTVTRRTRKARFVRAGSIQSFTWKYTNENRFCWARITKVERGKLGDVDELEAKCEGFDSLKSFKEYYGDKWNPKLAVWVIRFEVLPNQLD